MILATLHITLGYLYKRYNVCQNGVNNLIHLKATELRTYLKKANDALCWHWTNHAISFFSISLQYILSGDHEHDENIGKIQKDKERETVNV